MKKLKNSKTYPPSFTERIRSGELTLDQAKNLCDQASAATRRKWEAIEKLRLAKLDSQPRSVGLIKRITSLLGLAS
jgi:hypothetical protein